LLHWKTIFGIVIAVIDSHEQLDMRRASSVASTADGETPAAAAPVNRKDGTLQLPLPRVADAGVFRPVQYLGSKLRVLNAITSLAREIAPEGAGAVDLFAGSTVVSQGLAASGFGTTAVDTQAYSRVFAQALLGIDRAADAQVDAEDLLRRSENILQSDSIWTAIAREERDLIQGANAAALRNLEASLPLAWRHGRVEADADAPLTSFYAGSYFGVWQALQLDALGSVIASPASGLDAWQRATAKTALMHAASSIVHSAGKHFAQPLKVRAGNTAFHDRRLLSDRALNVSAIFREACAKIASAAPPRDAGHHAVTDSAEHFVAQPRGADRLYYLDPPYTAQQYSRFYHVLETIATSAAPRLPAGLAPTTGLYPGDRYKSAFSSRRRAAAAFATILGRVASLKAAAIVSYSVSSQGSDGNARMISLEELLVACRQVFGGRHVEMVELAHRYRQFNSGENANEGRDDKEVLVLCKSA
jgi:adenine-specific DNA-methyltransferase